jgi:hypothetical protein
MTMLHLGVKRTVLILLVVALAATLLLASSLESLELGPGMPFPGAASQAARVQEAAPATAVPSQMALPILRGLLAAAAFVLGLLVLLRIATAANLKSIVGILLLLGALVLLLLIIPPIPPGQPIRFPVGGSIAVEVVPEVATEPLSAPPISFVWVAALIGVIGATLVAWTAVRRIVKGPSVGERIRNEASVAVDALEAGADSTNVIVRCYLEMTRIIREEWGLQREHSMTVREFESALEALSLPAASLGRLRTLFEAVRYGNRTFTPEEGEAALANLKEIARFVRGFG